MSAKLKFSLLATIFILGYTSLSFELIMLRQMVNFVGSNTLITSIVMAFILLFLSVGYYIGSVISFAKYAVRNIIHKIFFGLAVWYVLACSYYVLGVFFYEIYFAGVTKTVYQIFVLSSLFLVVPSVGLGFVTAALGRVIHHFDSDYTGRFMAVDTLGSVLGSLVTTLVLMPLFGVFAAVTMIVFLTSFLLFVLSRPKERAQSLLSCFLLTACAFVVSNDKFVNVEGNLVLDNAIARVEVVEEDLENGEAQSKVMIINGSFSSKFSNKEELMFPYVQYINKTYIDNLPQGKVHDILILGAGGFTIGMNDKKNQYTYLDIIKELPEITEEKFEISPLSVNKKFIFEDAYLFLLKSVAKYDIIVVDVYSSKQSIPVNFVTVDFFKMVKEHLSPEGMAIFNIITSPSFKTKFSKRIDNTLRYVFPHSLNRQVVSLEYVNPNSDELRNVIYTYYNGRNDKEIFTVDKNSAVFGQ